MQIHVTNRQKFQPFRVGLALLTAAYQLYPYEFSWRSTTYEFIDEVSPIDLLFGSNQLRRTLESHKGLTKVLREMKNFEKSYALERQDFVLYN